jgi:acetamidase/formamidase
MATHRVEPEPAHLHGAFSAELAPMLEIDPGDTVIYRTLMATWWDEPARTDGGERRRVQPPEGIPANGHALTGPVAIRGAEPGMTLAIHIDRLVPGSWGQTWSGGWDSHVNRWFRLTEPEHELTVNWALVWDDARGAGIGRSSIGYEVDLRPFLGVIGLPVAEPGWQRTSPPRRTGGNLDCAELVAGSTLYLPVEVPGARVSVGDGHGRQSDGESSGTAIECPMDVAQLTYDLLPDQVLPGPWAETPAGTITFGVDEDLDTASLMALEAMVTLLGHRHGLSRQEALVMASVVVDLRVTQIVNGVQGVHAILPNGAIRRSTA